MLSFKIGPKINPKFGFRQTDTQAGLLYRLFLSNVHPFFIVIGDKRKYLSCLITLKCKVDEKSGIPTNELEEKAVKWCDANAPGSNVVTIEDFKRKKLLQKAIQKGLENANLKATANPCKVQKFTVLPQELSVQGGELGPTLKLKRHFIMDKYQDLIDEMYTFNQ